MTRVGILGFGNMGEALAAGLGSRKDRYALLAFDPLESRMKAAAERHDATLCGTAAEVFEKADVIVVAVKPQYIRQLADATRHASGNASIISVAAGVSISRLCALFDTRAVVRFMPNLAATEGKALVAVAHDDGASDELVSTAMEIASAVGTAVNLPEHLMPAITGLSGSGIAFVWAFIHAAALGAVKCGIPYADAVPMAVTVMEGAVALAKASGENPVTLLSRVISPAGTTIEGIAELESGGFTDTVMRAVEAAARRAEELERPDPSE